MSAREILSGLKELRRGERGRITAMPDVARIRKSTGLSQARFAQLLGVSPRTLQDWEQGRRAPQGSAYAAAGRVERSKCADVGRLIRAKSRRKRGGSGRADLLAGYLLRESTSTMRVCQPGPLAFQRASTSGGRRKDIAVRGASLFGRPLGFNSLRAIALPKISGSTSRAGRARRKSSAVHGGLSGSVRTRLVFRLVFIEAYFSLIRLPKADDVRPAFSWRVDQHVQA